MLGQGGGRVYRDTWTGLATAAAIGLIACSQGRPMGEAGVPGPPHGCWALEVTATDTDPDSIRVQTLAATLPPIVELEARPAPSGDTDVGPYVAYSWFNGRRESDPFSVWDRTPGDSIRVQREGALAGVMLRLAPSAGRLVGTAVSFGDVSTPSDTSPPRVPVMATRVSCPEAD